MATFKITYTEIFVYCLHNVHTHTLDAIDFVAAHLKYIHSIAEKFIFLLIIVGKSI